MRMATATGNRTRKYNIADHLFFKLRATPACLAEAVDTEKHVVKKHGEYKFWPAQNEEAEAMWTDRKNGHYAGLAYAGEGAIAWSMGVVRMNLRVLSSLTDTPSFLVIVLQRPDLEASTARI